jgi:8-oxo-dGTP pyrophosphatase MutT (NUDIX family)
VSRGQLVAALRSYKTSFPEEKDFIPRFLSLLQNFDHCYKRSLLSGHMTGSALITNSQKDSILLVHHKKLNRWLQPGGHADGQENILNVARREGEEETGIRHLELLDQNPFDIDIHLIPPNNKDQSHFHFDIRFLFLARNMDDVVKNEESNKIEWAPIDRISDYVGKNRSISRMCEKLNVRDFR